MPKKDENQIASFITQRVIESAEKNPSKNPAAVALGRLGGLKGGKARAKKLSAKRRRQIAKRAADRRWNKEKK